jgi:hypothetical protein
MRLNMLIALCALTVLLSGCVQYNFYCAENGEQRVRMTDNKVDIFDGNKADLQAALAQPNSPVNQHLTDEEKANVQKKLNEEKCEKK